MLVLAALAVVVTAVLIAAGGGGRHVAAPGEPSWQGLAGAQRPRIAVVGGVAANSELRAALPNAAFAPLELCTDNAAMIASAARYTEAVPFPRYLALDAYASR